jgi:hypothetical protein
MATLEIYEPLCEVQDCGSRATRRLKTEAGTYHFYCTKHSGPALTEQTKKEAGQRKTVQS